ncbi:MAG: DUF835 domain-containing protein [Thermoplasmata archaeon]
MIDEEDFRPGEAYLLETLDERHIFRLFKSLSENKRGLCISRDEPDTLRKRYGLQEVEFGLLSDSDDPYSIGPNELDVLGLTVKRFISEEEGVILLDGLDFLLINNSDENVIRLLNSLQQQMIIHTSILMVILDRSELEKRAIDILKEKLDFETMRVDGSAGEKGIVRSRKRKNLVREVREMMDFLKTQKEHFEEDMDQMKTVGSMDDREVDFEKVQSAIEDLREENRDLREELKKVRKQTLEGSKGGDVEGEIADEILTTIEDEKEGIKEEVEKIESDEAKGESRSEVPMDFMDTLIDLKEEVKSLRGEVKEIKGGVGQEKETGSKDESKDSEEALKDENIIGSGKFTEEFANSEGSEEREDRTEEFKKIDPGEVVEEDVFSSGALRIGSGAKINGSLEAEKDIVLEDEVTVEGKISSEPGEIDIGRNCIVKGKISGKRVFISSGSDVGDIEAEEEVDIEKKTKVKNIYCEKDVYLSEEVEVSGDIYYGGEFDMNIPDPTMKKKTHPIEEAEESEEEIVEERWASG